jgi:nucleotide-binding universal stress UspA family protein
MTTSLRKVLLAIDGSLEAALAVRAAAEVSRMTNAELHMVHVFPDVSPPSRPGSTTYSDYTRLAEGEARDLLRKLAWTAWVDGGEVSGEHLRMGKPAQEINTLAAQLDVDLVVLSGSVSTDVLRAAVGPVLVVPSDKASEDGHA